MNLLLIIVIDLLSSIIEDPRSGLIRPYCPGKPYNECYAGIMYLGQREIHREDPRE